MTKDFLKQEKWAIVLFLLAMTIGYASSVILIGGPVTYSAPMGSVIGFLLFESWNFRRFKKEWRRERYRSTSWGD